MCHLFFLCSCSYSFPKPSSYWHCHLQALPSSGRTSGTRVRWDLLKRQCWVARHHLSCICVWHLRCFISQGPFSLWLWASSSPPCCWWWSAAVSGSSDTSSRKPAHSQQRSPITSSTACICSQSGEMDIEEIGTLLRSLELDTRLCFFWTFSSYFFLSCLFNLSSFKVENVVDCLWTQLHRTLRTGLFAAAFKARKTTFWSWIYPNVVLGKLYREFVS